MFSDIKKNYEFYKKNFYRGKDIYCPFCSGSYKAQKYKFTKTNSTLCPVCNSTIEERTILLFLQAKTEILPGEPKILVISEEGKVPEYFRNFPNAEVKIYTETGDFTIRDNTFNGKYETSSYDLILCNYILEKLPDYLPVLKELNRILKSEGFMLLQANIDYEKDKTAEYPLTSYKDRIAMYGIPGNHRRFGKDYQTIIKSTGLNISKLKFTSGFEELPPLSFDREEMFYIAYKSDQPVLFDNMDDLEAEMTEQRSNIKANLFSAFAYTILFILPELIRNSLLSIGGKLSEREENKGTFAYMLYILITGLVLYWSGLVSFLLLSGWSQAGWLIGIVVLLIVGFGGAAVLSGYVFLNDKAGYIKKSIVGFFLFLSLWLPFIGGLLN